MQYSNKNAIARARLLAPYNDIDLFIEDRNHKRIVEDFVRQHLPKGVKQLKISSAVSLNGRAATIKAAHMYNCNRPAIFLIDGDLDIIAYKYRKHPSNVVALSRYSVENFLFDFQTIQNVFSFMEDVGEQEAITELDIDIFTKQWKALRYLYISYAVGYRLGSELQSVGFSIARLGLCEGTPFPTDPKKIFARIREYWKNLIVEFGQSKVNQAKHVVKKYFKSKFSNSSHFLPGKQVLLQIAYSYYSQHSKNRLTFYQFIRVVAREGNWELCPSLASAIEIIHATQDAQHIK